MTKPTIATLKSFVRKNRSQLLVKAKSSFDGMTDCVQFDKGANFKTAEDTDLSVSNTLGIRGLWIVGGSGNWVSSSENDDMCSFEVAVRKQAMAA